MKGQRDPFHNENFLARWMVGCDSVKERRKSHSPRVTWQVFSFSMYHNCEWQTLIFFSIESMWKLFFFLTLIVLFCFIFRLFYSFKCVWFFCIYSMYMLRLLCMWCNFFFFLYLTLECMYCTYIYFPHMFIIKNKKKEKLQTVRDL